ncbi:MAG: glycosyl hydrolase, partial [Acidobacteriota bacterium]
MRSTLSPSLSMLVFALALSPPGAPPVSAEGGDPFAGLELRNVGPLHPSGRVADVEGVPGNPRVLWVGSASGGVWKTTNGGHDFVPVFDDQPIASIGDLALAPSNPEVVYVGSGEGNPRNSVSFGNGVYRTNDGGDSWSHLGLEATRHITRVLVHPTDPDTVWVGALGSVYGPGEERGVFRSTDGGETWTKTLYVDDRHGVADMDIDPENPNVLFAALWRFDRKPWTHSSGSEEGGLFRSVDGGVTWTKLENGLPSFLGRVGVKVAPSNPRTVYAITESHEGTLYRSDDRGETFRQVHDEKRIISRGLYYTDLRVDPVDENRVYAVSSRLFRSIDGGKTFEQISRTTHVDYHSLWIDPEHPERMWQGQDGGVAVSYDRGETWEPFRNLPLGQFYQVFADQRQPFYQLGGGMQDNGAWSGPSRTREPGGILPDDWRIISFGDAYFTVPHPDRVDLFLSESQGGGIVRTDMVTRQQVDVSPQPKRNDGGPVEDLEVRFNWNAPIVQSPHDPHKIYFAGNVVFETRDFGETWTRISPDLTTDDPEKQGEAGAPGWIENTTAEYHCTIISFAESPVEAGVLWAGTDDGNLQLSKDGGATWTDLTAGLGVPEFSPVSHVEPSAVDGAVAYVAFDRHMFDDLRPHIYRTTDYGATWTRMVKGIGEQSWVWVVKEDPQNPDVLYAGTELGLFVSFDAGGSWRDMRFGNFPPVSVHDLFIHPRENDLVIGTHGRAIWVLDDVTALQQWGDVPADRSAFLFDPRPALRFPRKFTRYGLGDKELTL